jgi:hypothetical protein
MHLTASPFDRVIQTQRHRTGRSERPDQGPQQYPSGLMRRPARPVEQPMRVLEMGVSRQTHRAQGSGDGRTNRGEQRPAEQSLRTRPGRASVK